MCKSQLYTYLYGTVVNTQKLEFVEKEMTELKDSTGAGMKDISDDIDALRREMREDVGKVEGRTNHSIELLRKDMHANYQKKSPK